MRFLIVVSDEGLFQGSLAVVVVYMFLLQITWGLKLCRLEGGNVEESGMNWERNEMSRTTAEG